MDRQPDLDIEEVLERLDLPIDAGDLFEQLENWRPMVRIDESFLELTEPAFLEAAVAILLELLIRKRGLDLDRVTLMLRLVELAPAELFGSGAMGRGAVA